MKKLLVAAAIASCGIFTLTAQDTPLSGATTAQQNALVVFQTYCTGCHTGTAKSVSGPLLDKFDTERIREDQEAWARAYRHLQAGTMPPVGAKRPDRATADAALKAIEDAVASDSKPDVSGVDVSKRLAKLLWNSEPDEALLQAASGLNNRANVEAQVRRMLADERARAFVAQFFFPWLGIDGLAKQRPDSTHFPDYDNSLNEAFGKETELFLLSQLRGDRDPIELWRADYSFLNEQLAKHYGIEGVNGAEFRRVSLQAAPERAGLLGHGSVLIATSRPSDAAYGGYTDPASRAKWVLNHYLGVRTPYGFPGAGPMVPPDKPITPQTRSLPASPCVGCHRNFFPLGYALENFDPVGRWRTEDRFGVVDASGAFVDGTPMNGVQDLREVLLTRPDAFRTTITEALLVYATTGEIKVNQVNRADAATLFQARRILRDAPDVRWSTLIAEIVRR
jgi:hypothetical protein